MVDSSPKLLILSSPSGGGKTSLARALSTSMENVSVSISHTTRPQRAGEQDGEDYFFVGEEKFKEMIDSNKFLEHARVFEHLYGTARLPVQSRLNDGQSVILDIDWQGARQIRNAIRDTLSVFVLPPSLEDLERRLLTRERESRDIIDERMRGAISEISHYVEFDYVIINEDFSDALSELRDLLQFGREPRSAENIKRLSFLKRQKTVKLKD
ncbi:MAG: guanylate kinase [Acidiferrobacteraceae bacterium]|nr:guanylate kinase [Acidiferrobacteraceae bacterium]|tara:strand:- start:345 stop:980 length:636 start_codon:yes stop_codon:yes gene_type:complete